MAQVSIGNLMQKMLMVLGAAIHSPYRQWPAPTRYSQGFMRMAWTRRSRWTRRRAERIFKSATGSTPLNG